MPSAAIRRICCPTGTEPVRLTLRITGDARRCRLIIEELPVTTLTRPAGISASWQAWASIIVVRGASTAGLTTSEHPAASAGAILRPDSRAGKFHGLNAATGPTGCRITSRRCAREWPSTIRP